MIIKKQSAWQFSTSSSGAIGVEFVAAEGGTIYMQDPAKKTVSFRYGAVGAGICDGFKLPVIGKPQVKIGGKSVAGAVAPAAFPNAGVLYILEGFDGEELTRSDITGVCMFLQVDVGLVAGTSGYAMLLGMDPVWLGSMLVSTLITPAFLYSEVKLIESATAILIMGGLNVGVQAGWFAGAFIGGLD
jgi:hypothetical protein